MNFSDFLKKRRTQKKLASARDHFDELGGEEVLGISLRHFQQIESGRYPPSEKLLAVLFLRTPAPERRTLVVAYFRSIFGPIPGSEALIDYVDQHLTPALERESKSLWESGRKVMMYTEEQLDFLTKNADALRFHRRVLLLENLKKDQCPLKKEKLEQMIELDLLSLSGNEIRPSRTVYRIPNADNSGPRAVARATDYILKHLEVYAAREGSDEQELSYGMQMVSPAAAERILEQMKAFKRWVQSLASTEVGPEVSPLLFVGFARKIDRKELM